MRKYVEVFFRFWVRFTILLLIVPAGAGAATVLLFPTYKAYARLWVDNTSYFGTQPTGWSQYLTPAQNESDSLNQLMATRAFGADLDTAMQATLPDPAERGRALAASNLLLAPVGTHLLQVSATCETPSVCVAILQASVDVLRQEQVQLERDNARAGIDFLQVQLTDAQKQQQAAADALQQYILDHPGVKVDPTVANNGLEVARLLNNVTQTRDQVASIQTQLSRDQYIASVSTTVYEAGPRVLDKPAVTRGGLIGDGASLKKAAIAAGAIFGVGLTYLVALGWLDKTARDTREIEHRFGVRVVATIPKLNAVERIG